jgi:predicted  nucleic acid-binding Zn-ribbon protein
MTNSHELKAKILELEQSLFALKERKREDYKKIERLQADFNTKRQELEQLQRRAEAPIRPCEGWKAVESSTPQHSMK